MSENSPQKSGGKGLFLIVVIVLMAAIGVEAYLMLKPVPTKPGNPRPDAARQAISNSSQEITTFGQSSAPIKVKFYAPLVLDWHQKTIGLLKDYDKAQPGRIFVTLMPMGNAKCDTEMQDLGYVCATILVNGENEFTLADGRKVALSKRPNEESSFYNSGDVIKVIDQLSAKGK